MLMTLRLHLNHNETDDYVARAAILMVRFPNLMDQLLSDDEPPNLDPTTTASELDPAKASESPWHRRDVQHLLRTPDGNLIDIIHLARCFGREYPPPVPHPAPVPAPGETTPVVPTNNGSRPGTTAAWIPHPAAVDQDGSAAR
jgi:hypothetical protein